MTVFKTSGLPRGQVQSPASQGGLFLLSMMLLANEVCQRHSGGGQHWSVFDGHGPEQGMVGLHSHNARSVIGVGSAH